ncbi:hypothetical protein CGMCC3_g3452 [Colletotrichum fructicola]|nr:uncharacterized protein CGMCC3_g3452 [Colletotrichum fructicola]KAE9580629.1 hypothetical protein CGMCC3_g3452 [Colletotrichum fructicola]KAF4422403.1 hypothetical protein CFRS1_v001103 [Colletotrichum fructicola]
MLSLTFVKACVLTAAGALASTAIAESTWIRPDASGDSNFRGWYIQGVTTSPKCSNSNLFVFYRPSNFHFHQREHSDEHLRGL